MHLATLQQLPSVRSNPYHLCLLSCFSPIKITEAVFASSRRIEPWVIPVVSKVNRIVSLVALAKVLDLGIKAYLGNQSALGANLWPQSAS